jgi:hypothetical protein
MSEEMEEMCRLAGVLKKEVDGVRVVDGVRLIEDPTQRLLGQLNRIHFEPYDGAKYGDRVKISDILSRGV